MKRLALAVLSWAILLEPALAQQDREAREPIFRQVEQESQRTSERHSRRSRHSRQDAAKVGAPNPYEPKAGAPNPYATQGGTPNPYATQGGAPAGSGAGAPRR